LFFEKKKQKTFARLLVTCTKILCNSQYSSATRY